MGTHRGQHNHYSKTPNKAGEIIAYRVSLSSRFAKARHLQIAWQQIFDDLRGEQILIKEQFMIGKIGCKQSWL